MYIITASQLGNKTRIKALIKKQFHNARLSRGIFPLCYIITSHPRLLTITAESYHVVTGSSATFRDLRKQFRSTIFARCVTKDPQFKIQFTKDTMLKARLFKFIFPTKHIYFRKTYSISYENV